MLSGIEPFRIPMAFTARSHPVRCAVFPSRLLDMSAPYFACDYGRTRKSPSHLQAGTSPRLPIHRIRRFPRSQDTTKARRLLVSSLLLHYRPGCTDAQWPLCVPRVSLAVLKQRDHTAEHFRNLVTIAQIARFRRGIVPSIRVPLTERPPMIRDAFILLPPIALTFTTILLWFFG